MLAAPRFLEPGSETAHGALKGLVQARNPCEGYNVQKNGEMSPKLHTFNLGKGNCCLQGSCPTPVGVSANSAGGQQENKPVLLEAVQCLSPSRRITQQLFSWLLIQRLHNTHTLPVQPTCAYFHGTSGPAVFQCSIPDSLRVASLATREASIFKGAAVWTTEAPVSQWGLSSTSQQWGFSFLTPFIFFLLPSASQAGCPSCSQPLLFLASTENFPFASQKRKTDQPGTECSLLQPHGRT